MILFIHNEDKNMQTPKRKPNPYDLIPPDYHITQEAYDMLKREVEKMEKKVRPKIIEEMQAAAEHGDFSENFPYQNAKRRLRALNYKIDEYRRKITNAIIIAPRGSDVIQIGSTVDFLWNGSPRTYTLVGALEADPSHNKISHQTPIGKALLGLRVGDRHEVNINDATVALEILNIS